MSSDPVDVQVLLAEARSVPRPGSDPEAVVALDFEAIPLGCYKRFSASVHSVTVQPKLVLFL